VQYGGVKAYILYDSSKLVLRRNSVWRYI